MKERQKTEPRYLSLIQVIQSTIPSQTSADGRLVEKRFEDARYIGAMIDQRVPGWTAPNLVAKLAPEVAGAGPTLHRQLR